jgi:hypothetical protein
MLIGLAIALSLLWICACVLGLALGAMLARTECREPAERLEFAPRAPRCQTPTSAWARSGVPTA